MKSADAVTMVLEVAENNTSTGEGETMNYIKTKGIVKQILELIPETRNDDYYLWLWTINRYAELNGLTNNINNMNVAQFLTDVKQSNIPKYETVSRERRKLQAEYPELRGTPETNATRNDLEKKYRKKYKRKARE